MQQNPNHETTARGMGGGGGGDEREDTRRSFGDLLSNLQIYRGPILSSDRALYTVSPRSAYLFLSE